MTFTTKKLLASALWFVGFPVLVILIRPPGNNSESLFFSIIWNVGLCYFFMSWALRDARDLGVHQFAVYWLSAAWLLFSILCVFPYLFISRGLSYGFLASAKFLSFCIICIIFLKNVFLLQTHQMKLFLHQIQQVRPRYH